MGKLITTGAILGVLALISSAGGSDDKPESKSKPQTESISAKQHRETEAAIKKTGVKTAEPKPERTETQRAARKIARQFRSDWEGTDATREVKSFADDLDPWDGSLAVTLRYPASHYYDAEAHDIGAQVLGTGFPLGLCKVDVLGSDGMRIVEHKSQGRGCIEH